VWHVAHIDMRCMQSFGQKTQWEDSLGSSKHRWEDNIKMHPKEMVVLTGFIWAGLGYARDQ
jgi:hypothetical protein